MNQKLTSLICSKICHDLATPVGSVRMGLELLTEEAGSEALALCSQSANMAANRLTLLRFAFGYITATQPSYVQGVESITHYLDRQKWQWQAPVVPSIPYAGAPVQILLSLCLGVTDMAPHGGRLTLDVGAELILTLSVIQIIDIPNLAQILDGKVADEELTPKTISFYWAGVVARESGYSVGYQRTEGGVRLTIGKI